MSEWVRHCITFILIIVGAGLWGFGATFMGASSMVVSIGALAVGAAVFSYRSRE